MSLKLWHDDVRPKPVGQDWAVARTNAEALEILRNNVIVEASLDHDMGCTPDDGIYARGASAHDGVELCRSMITEDLVPPRVVIHSWNPAGAACMASELEGHCHDLHVIPYQLP